MTIRNQEAVADFEVLRPDRDIETVMADRRQAVTGPPAKVEMFEIDRLREALLAATGDAVDVMHSIRERVTEWTGDAPIDDDVTMMVVKRVK